jgi:hypothetical protein
LTSRSSGPVAGSGNGIYVGLDAAEARHDSTRSCLSVYSLLDDLTILT